MKALPLTVKREYIVNLKAAGVVHIRVMIGQEGGGLHSMQNEAFSPLFFFFFFCCDLNENPGKLLSLMSPVVLRCLALDNSWKSSCQCFIEAEDNGSR